MRTRILVVAAIMMLTLLGVVGADGAGSPEGTPQFGFNVMFWLKLEEAEKQSTLSLLKELDVKWVRLPFNWADIERQRGQFNDERQGKMIARFQQNGFKVLLFCGGAPKWAVKNFVRCEANPPDDPQDFARFMARAASRYKGVSWEIWNEPGNKPYWGKKQSKPSDYMALLKPVYKAIKKADPTANVVGGSSLVRFLGRSKFTYLDGLLKAGVLNYCDTISVHTYPRYGKHLEQDFLGDMATCEKMIRAHGDHEIWLTETGTPSARLNPDKLRAELRAHGLKPAQIMSMQLRPLCKLAFNPAMSPAMLDTTGVKTGQIEKALKPYGLTLEQAMAITRRSLDNLQEDQADLLEVVYEQSPRFNTFWFQLYDIALYCGVVDTDHRPKASYHRLRSLIGTSVTNTP
jgi:hypothetical protein